jgi:adenylate kinase
LCSVTGWVPLSRLLRSILASRSPVAVAIVGVSGAGKTVLRSALSKMLRPRGLEGSFSLSELVLLGGAWSFYDAVRKSFTISEEQACRLLRARGKKFLLIETHWPGVVRCVKPRLVLLVRVNPLIVAERLLRRGWDIRKVVENALAELLGGMAYEAYREANEIGALLVEAVWQGKPSGFSAWALGGYKARLGCCLDWDAILPEEGVNTLLECSYKPRGCEEWLKKYSSFEAYKM